MSCGSGEHFGLSSVMLLITLKSRSGDTSIGWMLGLFVCNVGVVAVDKEHLAKELNSSAFLSPVHLWRLFRHVKDIVFKRCQKSTV